MLTGGEGRGQLRIFWDRSTLNFHLQHPSAAPPPVAVGRQGGHLTLIPLGKTPPHLATVNGRPSGGQEDRAHRVPPRISPRVFTDHYQTA
ncbi:hypothetical protein EYF80_002366 [Liparis tanakae]|uniref:Uncharacterized protein n=1 Tax=Liparis tanakae TaxID=230148 RepID=A0A4Z2JBF3_9TELE|nr:hypothetical protein EYF80_002366 [Liparis tanakae]